MTEAMNQYDLEMIYKKGEEMPADYLSRNVISAISWSNLEMAKEQEADEKLGLIRKHLINCELPFDQSLKDVILKAINGCFIEDNVICNGIHRPNKALRVVIYLPRRLIPSVLQEAHGMLLAGHDRILKTKERIMQCYFWPGMDADIQEHIQKCHKCQIRRRKLPDLPHLLSQLPQCTEPQQSIRADLFGPLKTAIGEKKYILSMTDAFTKYVELVVTPSKEAGTIVKAIFNRWIRRYGCP